jgi:nucleotide-binding universal stress UspA family protein
MRFRRILMATDFSPGSRRALRHAEKIAKALRAELVLLHVVGPAVESPAEFAEANERLVETATKLSRRGCRVAPLMETGCPASAIVARAEAMRADLIVVGTAGRTGLSHLFLGSVAENVVRSSRVPVVTVRAPRPRVSAEVPRPEPPSVTLI